MGYTLLCLGLVVLLPLSALFLKTATLTWQQFWQTVTAPRVVASYQLTFGVSLLAATINLFAGTLVAWVLVRYPFPGKRLVDALVDLPFALPTAVAGIALTALYAPTGWIGAPLAQLGIKVAFTPLGILVALVFIGLPFVIRTVQPVLQDLDREYEEAAISLGPRAGRRFARSCFRHSRPRYSPATCLPCRARSAVRLSDLHREQHAIRVEITPLLIVTKLEQYDYAGATAIAVVMLLISFVLILAINLLQRWQSRRERDGQGPSTFVATRANTEPRWCESR
jgi:sulfate transport system permease protein